ncbi:MAG: hypothetical protein V3V08_25430 [Nannocystaceae bacterium]
MSHSPRAVLAFGLAFGLGGCGDRLLTLGGQDTDGDLDYLISLDWLADDPRVLLIPLGGEKSYSLCSLPNREARNSAVFADDGRLYVANKERSVIEELDPCGCTIREVGPHGGGTTILAPGPEGLLGVDVAQDSLVEIDTDTGWAELVGPLGTDFNNSGLAWLPRERRLIAVSGVHNSIFEIDRESGLANDLVALDTTLGTVGIEYHRSLEQVYVCSDDAVLYTLDLATGELGVLPVITGHAGLCDNLAAPTVALPCVR